MPIPGTWQDPKKKVTDDPGNVAPITITNVSVSGTGGGGATVSWTTDQPASSRVGYGVYPNTDSTTAETDTSPLVTSHSVSLTGLTVGRVYKFRVFSRYGGGTDGGGNSVMDGYSFYQDGAFVA